MKLDVELINGVAEFGSDFVARDHYVWRDCHFPCDNFKPRHSDSPHGLQYRCPEHYEF